ncbi:hypothetical protein GYH30_052385 [Glycine max]|nr:hypothetical protein GYH30_052385 [Glycine max]
MEHALQVVVASIGNFFVVTLLLAAAILLYQHHPSSSLSAVDASWSSDPNLIKISWDKLARATDNFSLHLIVDDGNFGLVYKARLFSSTTVAVKKLSPGAFQGFCEFTTEMETLSRLRHPNIVKILSYWASGPECLLVYEFIEKGNLDQWLHEPDLSLSLPPLPWPTRVNIICGVAHGLSYLHDLDKEEEQNVEALEEVIRLGGGVVEPEGLHEDVVDDALNINIYGKLKSRIFKDGQKDKPVFVNSYSYDGLSQHVVVSIHIRFLRRLFNNHRRMQSLKLQYCHRVSFNNVS